MDINEKIKNIRVSLEEDIKKVASSRECQELKVKYFGKQGLITDLTGNMK